MKLLSQMTYKEISLMQINAKRECNKLARSLGFKNYKQMCDEETIEEADDRNIDACYFNGEQNF